MSTCCWCTPGCSDTIELLLEKYASAALPPKEFAAANEDLCYCLECVDAYHKARSKKAAFHEVLWELETTRLIKHFQKSMEESGEDDSLFIVEEDREIPFSYYTGTDFESHLRVAFLEILKYPHLLNHPRLSRLFVEALRKLEQIGCSFQVSDKHPGIYLLMVHPNEEIRRWAILTARSLGKLNRDDYYELQEVLILLFTVIQTGRFENPSSVYNSSALVTLPPHLYDTTNYKTYWLGICMLLTVLEEQAMDSLLLGPDKQNDFIQCIINTMEKNTDDESNDPFWPALHCFMVILDKLGSKMWGEHIDKIKAFEAVINSSSYKKEISNIRQSCRTKSEPVLDYGDQSITCSQLVYDYNPEKPAKDTGWRTTICPDYVSSLYDDMQTLGDMFQHDIGEDMKLHHSTFLWFIPFVHSLIDLKECGVAYCQMVVRHLCSEIGRGFDDIVGSCDKVSEFLIWILVTVIELHLKKNYLNSLWLCLDYWVKTVVKCAVLPNTVFRHGAERGAARNSSRSSSASSREPESVQFVCMALIRNILKEGCKIGQGATCQPFLNELNLLRRSHLHWQLNAQRARELQSSLEQVVKSLQSKSLNPSAREERPAFPIKQERKDDRCEGRTCSDYLPNFGAGKQDEASREGPPSRRSLGLGEEDWEVSRKEEDPCRPNVPQQARRSSTLDVSSLGLGLANGPVEAQAKEDTGQGLGDQKPLDSSYAKYFDQGCLKVEPSSVSEKETNPGKPPFSSEKNPDRSSDGKVELKNPVEKRDLTFKLKQFVNLRKRQLSLEPVAEKLTSVQNSSKSQESQKSNVKSEVSSEHSCLGKLLTIKEESVDRLAEFKSNLKTEPCWSESSSSSEDDLDNVPLGTIRQTLVKKKTVAATDSPIDRGLSWLSLSACAKGIAFPGSSRENVICDPNRIKRKVKDAVPSWSLNRSAGETISKAGSSSNGIITISSDEDEGEGEANRPGRQNENTGACLKEQSSEQMQEPSARPSFSLPYEECESQLFEFETEDEVYSIWTDSQMDEKVEEKARLSPELEAAMELNNWGYDMDSVADDVAEKAADDLERQAEKCKAAVQPLALTGSANKENGAGSSRHFSGVHADADESFRHPGPDLPSKSASAGLSRWAPISKPAGTPKKNLAESKQCKTASKSPKRRMIKPNGSAKKPPQEKASRSTPAVVPPHKVRHIPEPTSLPVKLGLKKRVRVAADLSQRTQDSVAELRNYGKIVGELDHPQQRKSKLIRAPSLLRRNKSMLACQERQFYRQAKPKDRETNCGRKPRAKNTKVAEMAAMKPGPSASLAATVQQREGTDRSSDPKKKLRQNSIEKEEAQPFPVLPNKEHPLNQEKSTNILESVPASLGSLRSPLAGCSTSNPISIPASSSHPCGKDAASRESDPKGKEDEGEDDFDHLFLTQRDPVDMELCSQLEDNDPTGVGSNAPQSPAPGSPLSSKRCKPTGCAEKANEAGTDCQGHSARDPPNHVFAKPLAPPKLSTTKIFSTKSCSRSANLTKELEGLPRAPAASRSKAASFNPPASKGSGFLLRTPTLSSVLRPQNLNNVPQLQKAPGNPARLLASVGRPGHPSHLAMAPDSFTNVQRIDPRTFIKMVLKWNCDMLTHSGPPNQLLQSIVAQVPVTFRDYSDYFHTFFPLMMLDTFEMVAQEWQDNQVCKLQKPYRLDLLNFNTDKAEFSAKIPASDLDKQLHPKEDDLVFLIVSEKRNVFSEEGEMESRQVHHVGLVTRFSPPSAHDTQKNEQQVVCHLSIQTQGNLSRVDKQVRCVVASSLVSTQRRFRALLLLPRSPLLKAIVTPNYGDFCLRDPAVDSEMHVSSMKEFNEDQKRAIETAYSLVTQRPSLPQICVIHGPPGTGKSKTILGLLNCILNERSGKENPVQSLNAKIKRNRVLVCAPSNAAVDELMKKIILMFKEKCQDKSNPLGNCGDVNLVRLGQEKSISKDVRKFSLNIQVEYRINRAASGKDQDLHKRKDELDRQLDRLSYQRAMYRSESHARESCNKQLDDEICRLRNERKLLTSQLKELRGRSSQELKWSIILESHIICCTLNTSGSMLLEAAFRRLGCDPLSCIIVDEAGQSCEIETIIPLIHGCRKLVLVGDPKQLPPIVKSMKAQEYGYDQSLMGRLCRYLEAQDKVHQGMRLPVLPLMTQYRMHPDICLFPSNYIYNRSLKTDSRIEENRFSSDWPFVPYLLFDVLDGQEERENGSYANPKEVKLVIEIMKLIKKKKKIGFRHIGIITPYSAQKKRIMAEMVKEFNESSAGEVDTVDGFQGREKDCVIVTCVRANTTPGSIGFLKSLQRLNVTITRAKYSLFILGHLKTLTDNGDWNELIQDAHKRGAIVKTSQARRSAAVCYAVGAQKILKRGVLRGKRKAAVVQDASQPSASAAAAATATAVTPGSGRGQVLPGAHDPSCGPQARPPQEKPRDPRLARRADPAKTLAPCTEGGPSSSGGVGGAMPPGPDIPPAQRNPSSTTRHTSAPSHPLPSLPACSAPLPGKSPDLPDRSWGVPISADGARILGRGDHRSLSEWSRDEGYRLSFRRTSEEPREGPDPLDAKRRRTTY